MLLAVSLLLYNLYGTRLRFEGVGLKKQCSSQEMAMSRDFIDAIQILDQIVRYWGNGLNSRHFIV